MSSSRKRGREDSISIGSSSRGQPSVSRPKHTGTLMFMKNLSSVQETSENEEPREPMGEESQKITDMAKKAATGPKKTEGFAKRFQDQIHKDKSNLKKELRDRVKKTAQRDARHQLELQQYLPPPPTKSSRVSDNHLPFFEPNLQAQVPSLNDIALQMITSSQELIRDYTNLCKMLAAAEQPNINEVTKGWREDKAAVAQLLENGKRLSLRRIEELIPGDVSKEQSEISSESWYDETSHFFPVKRDDTRLHDTFRQATKGVRRMAREIPETG